MSNKIIRSALESRLNTWALAQSPPIPIAWQNMPFNPPTQARYIRAFLLPADTQDHAITCDMHTYIGIFQVSLCLPDGTGTRDEEELSELIINEFKQGTVILKSGLKVEINRTPSKAPAIPEPGLNVIPISIRYRAAT